MIPKSGIRFSEKIMPKQNEIDESNSAKLGWTLDQETTP
jgi:hypothetical protein